MSQVSPSREAFLERVRQAVRTGNRAGQVAVLPSRGPISYQGGGTDPATCFAEALRVAGGQAYRVPDAAAAIASIRQLVHDRSPRRILLGQGAFLDSLGLVDHLHAPGVELDRVETLRPDTNREAFFSAELAISGVHYLIAETGTIVFQAQPDEPRSVSLLAPVHIAVAHQTQMLPDLFDLFEPALWEGKPGLPSCLSLITGPSKTGDIELRLVTGVHGPGELHVVLVVPG